jgi:ribosomal protein S25
VVLRWAEASTAPEVGQTTVIRVLDEVGAEQNVLTGLVGDTYTVTASDLSGVTKGSLEFLSERGGIRSWDGARRAFDIRAGGYGIGYGVSYA